MLDMQVEDFSSSGAEVVILAKSPRHCQRRKSRQFVGFFQPVSAKRL